jgi:hypothetical protein
MIVRMLLVVAAVSCSRPTPTTLSGVTDDSGPDRALASALAVAHDMWVTGVAIGTEPPFDRRALRDAFRRACTAGDLHACRIAHPMFRELPNDGPVGLRLLESCREDDRTSCRALEFLEGQTAEFAGHCGRCEDCECSQDEIRRECVEGFSVSCTGVQRGRRILLVESLLPQLRIACRDHFIHSCELLQTYGTPSDKRLASEEACVLVGWPCGSSVKAVDR